MMVMVVVVIEVNERITTEHAYYSMMIMMLLWYLAWMRTNPLVMLMLLLNLFIIQFKKSVPKLAHMYGRRKESAHLCYIVDHDPIQIRPNQQDPYR
jgi:hypothetical protein